MIAMEEIVVFPRVGILAEIVLLRHICCQNVILDIVGFPATLVTMTVIAMLRTAVKELVRAVVVQNARLGMAHPVFPSQTAQLVHLIVILVRTMLVPEVLAHIRR